MIMRWRPRNFVESVLPLLTAFAIVGHGVFYYPPERRRPRFSFIYAITVTTLYYVLMAFTLKYFYDSPWYDHKSDRFFIIVYANVAIATLSQILSWYYMERLAHIVQTVRRIDETLQELGATFDYAGTVNLEIGMIVLWIVVTCILNGSEISWLVSVAPFGVVSIIISILHLPIHVNSMIAYNFSIVICIVKTRFCKANELLDNVVKPIRRPVNDRGLENLRRKISVIPFTNSVRPIVGGTAYKKNLIDIIKHVHLELSAAANLLNRAYGIQVALEITACFIVTTTLLFDIYTTALDPSLPRRYLRMIVQGIWCTTYFTKVIAINYSCEVISAEAHRTGDILHRMEKRIGDPELPDDIQQFSLQIMQNRLFFSPAGLVTLGWKFLRAFIGTVTTYLVIFIQNNQLPG